MKLLKNLHKYFPNTVRLAKRMNLIADPRLFLMDTLPKNSVGAEIGVHMGDFSKVLSKRLSPKELHLIDPWEHQDSDEYKDAWYGGKAKSGQTEMDQRHKSVCKRFKKEIGSGEITVHRAYSTNVLAQFPDAHFDWIYVDGNHLYDFVKADLDLSYLKIKANGFIIADDYMDGSWYQGGVKKAADEFVGQHEGQLITIRSNQFVYQKNP